jgi:phospholipase C
MICSKFFHTTATLALLSAAIVPTNRSQAATRADDNEGARQSKLSKIRHIVVIYQENHSFDNLYGGWEGVNGRSNAHPAQMMQVNQAGAPYACLLQNDFSLTSPPLSADCLDATTGTIFGSHFSNALFQINAYIPMTAKTCPPPAAGTNALPPSPDNLPGGCTRDLVHRFYQEQYQLNGGKQDRYVTGSDAVGLTMGYYDTQELPVYEYLHSDGHPHYAVLDNFFQAAFGGSFLNHQWLIAAATPTWPGAPIERHSVIDSNGMPNNYSLYHATGTVVDDRLTVVCPSPVAGLACGDYAVNTIQPTYQPHGAGPQLPPQAGQTIGDELSKAGVSWAWYSGGWSNANGDAGAPGWTNGNGPVCRDPDSTPNPAYPYCPHKQFQFHHNAFNYFASYAPDAAGRTHLRDEQEFIKLATLSTAACGLNSVSFVKPIAPENEHPGYTSETRGSDHLVTLLKAIEDSRCANDTMVIVTYDEFGGQWDHVPPPGQGGAPGVHDEWGPGTRIPALIISPFLSGNYVVDHTQYDTTSILATIERLFGVPPLSSRDALVNDLSNVYDAKQFGGDEQDKEYRKW